MKKQFFIILVLLFSMLCSVSIAAAQSFSDSPFSIFPEVKWNMSLHDVLQQDSYYAISDADSSYPNIRKPFLLDGSMAYVSYTFENNQLFTAYLKWYPNRSSQTDYKSIYKEIKQNVKHSDDGFVTSERDDWENGDVGWSWLGNGQMVSVRVTFGGEFGIGYSVQKTKPNK